MKKLFSILILALIVSFANAQLATVSIPVGASAKVVTTSYTLTNTTPNYLIVNAAQHYESKQDLTLTLHKASGSQTRLNIVLYGQKTADTPWVSLATGFWKLTSADTVMTISNGTAAAYRNFKALYTGTGTGTITVTKQDLKLWLQ